MEVVLKILSSMAPRAVLAAGIDLYGERGGVRFVPEAAGGVDVARRVMAGEAIDIVVLASDAIERLIMSGKLAAVDRVDLATSGIAMAVRAGTPHPQVFNEAAVKNAVLDAASISYSTGPSGTYLERLFDGWGILQTIRARIVIPPPGVPVARQVASGGAALGFQQLSELMSVPGVDVIGMLPQSIQYITTFSACISDTCKNKAAARDFLSFMTSSQADQIKRLQGMGTQ